MRPSYLPRLVNDPFSDPGLYIPFLFENRAILFDLGDISALSARDLLKVTHVFVTHTHMDHFVGFDRLLRLFLGREKHLYLFGPEGFLKNIEGKLAGYAWNLVSQYQNRFVLQVGEIRSGYLLTRQYRCRNGFIPETGIRKQGFKGNLRIEPALDIRTVILDHRIPCLGLTMSERFHINIKKSAVLDLDLEIGSWLRDFKQALYDNKDLASRVDIKDKDGGSITQRYRLGELSEKIAVITPGQKVTYIADVVYNRFESKKIIELAKGSDHLFIEAAFLEKDRDIARGKYHLTARQAGSIAGRAAVKQYTLFHFSPRYAGQEHLLEQEAKNAYTTAAPGD